MKCPQCGAENPAKNKFCGECGFNLKAVAAVDRMNLVKKDIPENLVRKILLTKDTIEKERRNVTVFFADISGFTTMSENLDPEELTLIMNECFRKLSMMVYRYEGIIDKFIGDCIMAIFGAPVTHEDDPERAILACLDMQTAINEINTRLEKSLKKLEIHTGINTGEVIAGKVGSDLQMDYTVMGDTVNVAQRLKDIATPGTIVIGPETYKRTRHAFDFMSSEPVQLKGKAESIKPYEVIGRKWGSEFGSSAVHSDLIGRDAELETLKDGYTGLPAKKPSIFLIKGEIGVGKSRLLYEFKKYLSISAPDIAILEDRGVSYESSIPLKSFYDCLTRYFLSDESRVTNISRTMIVDKISSILGPDAADILPYLCKLLNIELDEKSKEKIIHLDSHSLQLQIFLSVATLVEKIAEQKPLIFIFDDLQWSDMSSNDLISFLLPLVKNKRISFYLSYRVGEPANVAKILDILKKELGGYTAEIVLGNLSREDSGRIVENLTGTDIDPSLKNFIIEKSGGNPFFIEEIVRNIIESGVKMNHPVDAHKIHVPGSIESAVTSRLDALSKEAKYLVKIASIIGRFFPLKLMEEVIQDKEIYRHVEELENLEFLVKVNHGNKIFYSFRHPIFQEVAYHSLLKSERAIYHKVIAETIEAKFKDDIEGYFATLAHHYLNCQNIPKALEYSMKAGDEATGLYANDEALWFYGQALTVADDSNTKVAILEKISDLEVLTGKPEDAFSRLAQANELVRDAHVKSRLQGKTGKLLTELGKLDEGLSLMYDALKSFPNTESRDFLFVSYYLADIILERKADINQASELIEKAVTIAKKLDDAQSIAHGLRMKGQVQWRTGNSEQAMQNLKEAEKIYITLDAKNDIASLYILMGVVARAQGNIASGIDFMKKAIEISQRIGNKKFQAIAYNNMGIYYELIGDQKNAMQCHEKNLALRLEIGDTRGQAIAYGNIGILKNRIGDRETALDYFYKAQDILERVQDVRSQVNNALSICEVLIEQGELDEVHVMQQKALTLAESKDDELLVLTVKEHIANQCLIIDDWKHALEILDSIKEQADRIGGKELLANMRLEYARAHLKQGGIDVLKEAEEAFKQALELKRKDMEIHGLRTLGRAQVITGTSVEEGIRNIKRAIAIAKEIGFIGEMADSLLSLGEMLIAAGKPKPALEHLNQAKEIYSKVKAKLKLKKIKNLMEKIKE